MSCICFSKASYVALAENEFVQGVIKDARLEDQPVADALYKANCDAYQARYGEIIPYDEPDQGDVDHEFVNNLDNKYSSLWNLLGRIDYQLCEGDDYKEREGWKMLEKLQYRVASKMADILARTETPAWPVGAISLTRLASRSR